MVLGAHVCASHFSAPPPNRLDASELRREREWPSLFYTSTRVLLYGSSRGGGAAHLRAPAVGAMSTLRAAGCCEPPACLSCGRGVRRMSGTCAATGVHRAASTLASLGLALAIHAQSLSAVATELDARHALLPARCLSLTHSRSRSSDAGSREQVAERLLAEELALRRVRVCLAYVLADTPRSASAACPRTSRPRCWSGC